MDTKFALQAVNGYKIKSHESGLLLSAKGVNTLKFCIFTRRQRGIGNGNSAIRVGCAFNPNRYAIFMSIYNFASSFCFISEDFSFI
jgi:hypothetical protein